MLFSETDWLVVYRESRYGGSTGQIRDIAGEHLIEADNPVWFGYGPEAYSRAVEASIVDGGMAFVVCPKDHRTFRVEPGPDETWTSIGVFTETPVSRSLTVQYLGQTHGVIEDDAMITIHGGF